MIVGGVGRASVPAGARRTAPGRGFAVPDGAPGSPAPAVAESAPASALGGLLALQEQESGAVRDRAARRHGEAMLEALAALQRALLGPEGTDGEALDRLAALADSAPEAADPSLAAALRAVALRARVELARRGLRSAAAT